MAILSSCNENKRIEYNEDRNTAWSDTILGPSYCEEYTIRSYNLDGLLISSCNYGYSDNQIKPLITRLYHYFDGKLTLIEESKTEEHQHPNTKYLLQYDDNERLISVLYTDTTEELIYSKSEYDYNENGLLKEWRNTNYSDSFPRKELYKYIYKDNKLVKVVEGDENRGVEKYEYKSNGNLGKIIDLYSWQESNLIYNSNAQVIKRRNIDYVYDDQYRIRVYKWIDEVLYDTISVFIEYGHRPANIKYNNRFINDGGRFLNSRGQVYYKLCSFNNNYLPDGLGIRE